MEEELVDGEEKEVENDTEGGEEEFVQDEVIFFE